MESLKNRETENSEESILFSTDVRQTAGSCWGLKECRKWKNCISSVVKSLHIIYSIWEMEDREARGIPRTMFTASLREASALSVFY